MCVPVPLPEDSQTQAELEPPVNQAASFLGTSPYIFLLALVLTAIAPIGAHGSVGSFAF